VYRIQLTTDGHGAYLNAVRDAFRNDIDYAMLIKIYGESGDKDGRYSRPACRSLGTRTRRISQPPTSSGRTFRCAWVSAASPDNAFSKKFENHVHSLAIYFLHYNFVLVHQTVRVTPAMAAGVVDTLWDMGDMLRVGEEWEAKQPHEKPGRNPKATA
jgi:hypothetical protein